MSQLTASMAPDPVNEMSVPDLASAHTHPTLAPEPATARAPTFIELLWVNMFMKTVRLGSTTIASTKPLSPAYFPYFGGTLIETVAPPVPFVTPFTLAAACPAVWADEVEELYL